MGPRQAMLKFLAPWGAKNRGWQCFNPQENHIGLIVSTQMENNNNNNNKKPAKNHQKPLYLRLKITKSGPSRRLVPTFSNRMVSDGAGGATPCQELQKNSKNIRK